MNKDESPIFPCRYIPALASSLTDADYLLHTTCRVACGRSSR